MSTRDSQDSISVSNGAPDAPAEVVPTQTVEIEKLIQEKADLEDRFLRLRAEFDNFRKRAEREKVEILEYASMDATRSLLPILDDFARALASDAPDDPKFRDFVKGMQLIEQRLREALTRLGLEPVEALGKTFDPHYHEALQRRDTADAPDGTVLAEFQKGYLFKGRLLRPAMVAVAVNPAPAEPATEAGVEDAAQQ